MGFNSAFKGLNLLPAKSQSYFTQFFVWLDKEEVWDPLSLFVWIFQGKVLNLFPSCRRKWRKTGAFVEIG